MPIFEFQCRQCGMVVEKLVFRREEPSPSCPGCSAPEMERIPSVPAVQTRSGHDPARFPCEGSGSCCGSDLPASAKPCMRRADSN